MIPFNQIAPSKEEEKSLIHALRRVIQSGAYLLGKELFSFEEEFAQLIGIPCAMGVGSGTDSLTLGLRALGLRGKEVIIPANAYPTAFGVANARVEIRLCDVDPETLVVSVPTLERVFSKKTRAIVIVHLYGFPAPIQDIVKFANLHRLLVIEDCAQAVGAYRNGRHVGTFGDIGCFSFYPTKNLGALGDGGMVVTKSKEIAEKIRQLRAYGEDERYHSLEISGNSRLDEMQCSILRFRLQYIAQCHEKRIILAMRYRHSLSKDLFIPQTLESGIRHANHLFVLKTKHRGGLKDYLKRKEIETMIHYPTPIHLQPAFSYLGYKKGDFPVSEQACREVLSLPFYIGLKKHEQDRIIETINTFTERYGHS